MVDSFYRVACDIDHFLDAFEQILRSNICVPLVHLKWLQYCMVGRVGAIDAMKGMRPVSIVGRIPDYRLAHLSSENSPNHLNAANAVNWCRRYQPASRPAP